MKLSTWLALLSGAAVMGFVAAPARAAPAGALHAIEAPAASTADVQKVYWYRRHHHRYYYRYRYYRPWYYHHHHHRYWHRRYW